MPPAFGTGPVTGPPVSTATFAEAEKLVQVVMKPEDRAQAAASWQRTMAPLYERRTGPRKVTSTRRSHPHRSGIRCCPARRPDPSATGSSVPPA